LGNGNLIEPDSVGYYWEGVLMREKAKKKQTPVGRISSALRKIWMWSPERAVVMKRAAGICEECGCTCGKTKKQAEAKKLSLMEIHHVEQCNMTKMAKEIHAKMFPGEDKLDALCQTCHVKADEILNKENNIS
jgi:hypothetical protein